VTLCFCEYFWIYFRLF